MSKLTHTLGAAIERFLIALHGYQKATLDMNRSLERLNRHQLAFCRPLKTIIETTGSAIAPRNPRARKTEVLAPSLTG